MMQPFYLKTKISIFYLLYVVNFGYNALSKMLWSYSKRFLSLEKYIISITLNVPIDIPNIYFKITVLYEMNHFTFFHKSIQNIMTILIPQEKV